LVEASCGDDCTVVEPPNGSAVLGTRSEELVLAVTALSPGRRTLEVVVQDDDAGVRAASIDLEFADVDHIGAVHDAKRDPGVGAPMLPDLSAEWCVRAFAADERPIELSRSLSTFESRSAAIEELSTLSALGPCFPFRTALPGVGHVVFSAAGLQLDYAPEVLAPSDVAEIHLHRASLNAETWLPLDQAGDPDGAAVSSLVLNPWMLPLELVVRLTTRDGRVARGGARSFRADHDGISLTDAWGSVGQSFMLDLEAGPLPKATCLRAAIGAAQLEVPVYIDGSSSGLDDPCAEPPMVPVPGTGGLGGGDGSGGAGGHAGAAGGGQGGQAP